MTTTQQQTGSAWTSEPLLVIVGPTASGKTDLSIALAEALNGEILSADSVQIYRHFDIGSGKPSESELARVPHHFIGTLDPLETIDAAGWASQAEGELAEIRKRGRRPIVCGGSFLWVRALLFGLAEAPPANATIRQEHQRIAAELGRPALHQRLAAVDAATAARLAPNDFVRVSRALEVFELSGKKMSDWQADHGFRQPKRPYRLIGVARERAESDQRIRDRAAQMLNRGLITEVKSLCERGYEKARAMGSVGYRETYAALKTDPLDEGALLDAISQKTRVFARRQRTWLRDEPVTWVRPELQRDVEQLVAVVNTNGAE